MFVLSWGALLKNWKIFIKVFFSIFSQKFADTKEPTISAVSALGCLIFQEKLEIHQQIYSVGMLEC